MCENHKAIVSMFLYERGDVSIYMLIAIWKIHYELGDQTLAFWNQFAR